MLAFQQQIKKPVLGGIFTQPKNKNSIYDADDGAVVDISEACPVKGPNLFITEAKCNNEVVTIPDDQEEDPVDETLGRESDGALLALSNSEN
ncbi:unnamed protein product [Schistosoma margrebowiei]|uniref:Uncharacterized protein n=1 Tax=Schistosoma margrebowiei TaxID=48269 RepID=A0A183M7J8_9TREM|nr:unnamed protein product [Schistosoma margrebowiei]